MVTWGICISETTRFMVSIGQGAPAMTPVRKEDRSNCEKLGTPSMATNMVGTPCSAVQRSDETAAKVETASKDSPGKTMQLPLDAQTNTPSTIPKQWYRGTGTHRRSLASSRIAPATKRALFTTL